MPFRAKGLQVEGPSTRRPFSLQALQAEGPLLGIALKGPFLGIALKALQAEGPLLVHRPEGAEGPKALRAEGRCSIAAMF